MQVCVLGVNFKTAPVELRERVSIPSHKTQEFLKELERRSIFNERLILSTCNRTEIYGADIDAQAALMQAKRFLSDYSSVELSHLEPKLYSLGQPDSIKHLFSVAAGLDSMVIGETEITGQVKDAYLLAHSEKQTGKVLNHLFQKSLKVAKDLRTQTGIGAGRVSVASVAVDLAEKIFGELTGTRVMVIGTGQMSTQLVKAMIGKGAKASVVSSRHHERAVELGAELGAQALKFDEYEKWMPETDVLIAATEAPTLLVREEQVKKWMKKRSGRPLFLIDIAVPRNIDSSCNSLDSVYLYNVDDLQEIADKNRVLRETQLEKCLSLVGEQTQHFMNWLNKEFASGSSLSRG